MSRSLKQSLTQFNSQQEIELRHLLDAARQDIANLRAAFVALTAKMDADFADVTNASTDYAASVDPDALNFVE